MPEVVRQGDRAHRGGQVVVAQSLASSEGQRDATVGDSFVCARHPGPPEHRLVNGCWFNRVEGRPVAVAFVTKASCGCRIVTGSAVYRCCRHLEAKARRLAERENLIEGARAMARQDWCDPVVRDTINEHADRLERLNQDVRYADASVAVYGGAEDRRFTAGHGNDANTANSPEGMIRLSADEYLDQLPEALRDRRVWRDPDSGLQAALYYDELTGQYIVAFRGTDGLSDKGDLLSNVLQAHGEQAPQYDQAMELGQLMAANQDSFLTTGPPQERAANLHFTGHSLGGGLGACAGTVAGFRFTTFNAAGVHENTIPRFTENELSNADGHRLGRRYFTSKDPLTLAQTERGSEVLYEQLKRRTSTRQIAKRSKAKTGGRLPQALGEQVQELPNHAWRTATDLRLGRTRDAGYLGGHSMLTAVQGIESQKEESIAALQNLSRTSLYLLHKRSAPPVGDEDLRWVFEQPVWESW